MITESLGILTSGVGLAAGSGLLGRAVETLPTTRRRRAWLIEDERRVGARDRSGGATIGKAAVLELSVSAVRPSLDLPRRKAGTIADPAPPLVSWLDAARPSAPTVSPSGPTYAAPAVAVSTNPAPVVDGPQAAPAAAPGFAYPAPVQAGGGSGGPNGSGGGMMRAAAGLGARLDGLEGGPAWSLSLPSAGAFENFPLYTLDANHGTVLFPNAPQIGIRGESVDLRAQVRDTTAVSYSWDVSGLTHAHAIAGSSSYRLQFQWDSTIAVTGSPTFVTDTATLTVTNASMETEVQTYTFLVPVGGATGSAGGASWPAVIAPDAARPESPAFVDHNGTVDSLSGAFNAAIALPSYTPNFPGVSFTYNSLAADPRPIVVANHVLDDSLAVPSIVSARLDFHGGTGSTYSYDTSTFTPGDVQQIALQANANGLGTGRYAYSLVLDDVRSATTTTTTSGKFNVVDDSTSPFGAGWTLDGLERVVAVPGEGVILTLGGGRSLWFAGTFTGAGAFTAPSGEFSTLSRASDGTYSRTLTNGAVTQFDASGKQVSVTDRTGQHTLYAYDGSGRLTTITDPYGKVTTLAYTAGLLATVTDPAGRTTTFAHSGAALTAATLPDASTWGYAYDGSGRLTTLTDPSSRQVTVAYGAAGRVGTITRPDSTTTTYAAAQLSGWTNSGTSVNPAPATLLAEAKARATDPLGHTTDVRPDWNGLGLAGQITDALGSVTTYDRDANGLTTTAIDRVGRPTRYAYDSLGNVVRTTYADGYYESASYNGFAEPTAFTNTRGYTTTYGYDGSGNLTSVLDALGGLSSYTYSGTGRPLTATDPNSHTTSYVYDSQDRLTTITRPGGPTRLFGYDAAGNVVATTDERGHATTASYDLMNRLTGVTDPLANHTTIVYDSAGNLIAVQAPLSRTTSYAYDAMNRVIAVTAPLARTTTYGYDSAGNRTTVTDPMGRVATTTYDALGRPTTVTQPLSRVTTIGYDGEGAVTRVTDPLSRVTTRAYDARGRLQSVVDPLGRTVSYAYTPTGQVAGYFEPGPELADPPRTTTYNYDALDRVTAVTDPLGHAVNYGYDGAGNRTSVTDALSHTTTIAYDARDRITAVTDPLGHATNYGYDGAGNQTSVTDALSHTATTAYDALNRAVTITDALGGTIALTYDAAGRQTQVTDPVGNTTTTTYDAADRPTAVTDALGTASYSYNADDELTDRTDRAGRHTQFGYDGAGRRTQERWLDGSGATVRTIAYTYDAADQLTGVTDPDATLTFSYDAAGQVLTAGTSSPAGQPAVTLTTAYDQAGRRKTLTDNLASVGQTSYTYDNASRLTTLSRTVGGAAGPKVEFGYDAADRLTSLRRTNGTSGGGGGLEGGGLEGGGGGSGSGAAITTTIGYDAADRLTAMTHQVEGGATLAAYAYAYDAANRVSSETNAEGTVHYSYDITNQLTGASGARTESYGYDLAGNRNTTGYTTTTGNRMTASPGATYTHDAEGNRTGKTDTATGNTTAYIYDYRNRLTSVTERNSGGTLLHQVNYTYDALDRRIGVNSDGTQTWTVHDGQNTYADFNAAGSLATRYLYGPAVDELLARTSSGGTTAWYLTDRLGSVRDLAGTSGTVIDHVVYDSFGNVLSESSPANGDAFKYTGREWDSIASLQFNRARYYDPAAGRWVARDPIGFAAGDANLNRYVNNDPRNRVDPTGLSDTLDSLPGRLKETATSHDAKDEASRIGAAIRNTYDNNWRLRIPSITKDERNKGYYCYEWSYAFDDAFKLESSGAYFKAVVEEASSSDGRVHFWLKITSKETGQVTYVDDGFVNGDYVHTKRPIPNGWEIGNPGDVPRNTCSVPTARDSKYERPRNPWTLGKIGWY